MIKLKREKKFYNKNKTGRKKLKLKTLLQLSYNPQ